MVGIPIIAQKGSLVVFFIASNGVLPVWSDGNVLYSLFPLERNHSHNKTKPVL